MALDGITVGKISKELNNAVDSHVEKIYQPSKDELVLLLRKKDFNKRLFITAASGASRVQFTENKLENPEKPPMFCMLARKYFGGARLLFARQIGFDRIIELSFEATNELGDRVNNKIVCELIGNKSNIVLVNSDNKVIDAVRRSDISLDTRIVAPGAKYVYPDSQDKSDILCTDTNEIFEKIVAKGELPPWKAILETIGGTSPLTAREIVYKSGLPDSPICEIPDLSPLRAQLEAFSEECRGNGRVLMLIKDKSPFDFSFTDVSQYGDLCEKRYFNTYSEMLDSFYLEREKAAVTKRLTFEVNRLVTNLISRANKRLSVRVSELESCKNREELRIKGEILKANISLVPAGAEKVRLMNFYDENLAETEIKLDPALNAQNNAAKYFKEYKKQNVKMQTLGGFIEEDKKEIEYLESILLFLSRCETVSELREIKAELKAEGYIKPLKNEKQKKSNPSNFSEYKSIEGYKILVGKNNLQNDMITTKIATKLDTWFHTKNIHGSHVVVFNGGGPLSEETVVFAATLAAKNSKAADSSNVPVDYTEIKNVKKPNGAKAGMVIYKTNKTVYVNP